MDETGKDFLQRNQEPSTILRPNPQARENFYRVTFPVTETLLFLFPGQLMMIRILHTSDWHLGKRLDRFSRHEEQLAVMDEICAIADREQADLVLIAGDLFDNANPPADSADLFYRALKRISNDGKRPVIAIAGNHDMPERIEAPDPLARECGIIFAGFPDSAVVPFKLLNGFEITLSEPGFLEIITRGKPPIRILLTPYANELRMRKGLQGGDPAEEMNELLSAHWQSLADKYCDEQGVNLMIAHLLFMGEGEEVPEEPEDERPINYVGGAQAVSIAAIPQAIQYAALGHLHRYQHIGDPSKGIVYSGSPLSYSFSEAGQNKYVILAELEPGREATIRPIELTAGNKLRRKRFENTEDAKAWLRDHPDTLVELTIVSGTFFQGSVQRELNEIHPGIVAIIPEIKDPSLPDTPLPEALASSKSLEELFREYFLDKKGQEPGPEIMNVFTEILGEEEQEN